MQLLFARLRNLSADCDPWHVCLCRVMQCDGSDIAYVTGETRCSLTGHKTLLEAVLGLYPSEVTSDWQMWSTRFTYRRARSTRIKPSLSLIPPSWINWQCTSFGYRCVYHVRSLKLRTSACIIITPLA